MRVIIRVEAELESVADADLARESVVVALENLLPYVFDNVIVTSAVEATGGPAGS